jgi:hypothetical protein
MDRLANREELSFFIPDLPSPDSLDAELLQRFATWTHRSDETPKLSERHYIIVTPSFMETSLQFYKYALLFQ